jgi:hypothetical protein
MVYPPTSPATAAGKTTGGAANGSDNDNGCVGTVTRVGCPSADGTVFVLFKEAKTLSDVVGFELGVLLDYCSLA